MSVMFFYRQKKDAYGDAFFGIASVTDREKTDDLNHFKCEILTNFRLITQ